MSASSRDSLASRLTHLPLYPWLLAIYPIGLIAVVNHGQVRLSSVLLAIVGGLTAASVCAGLFRALLGSWHKAALCTAVAAILFYGFGPIGSAIDSYFLSGAEQGEQRAFANQAALIPLYISAIFLAVLAGAAFVAHRLGRARVATVARPLNLVACLLIGTVLFQQWSAEPSAEVTPTTPDTADIATDASLPDIYYVILDGYARADILEKYYGNDNAQFLSALRNRGFAINERGYANYYWTFLSLASSLNMDYLPAVLNGLPSKDSQDRTAPYERIRDNAVASILRKRGYRFVQLQSTWGATLDNPHADEFVSCSDSLFTNEFFRTLAEASWLRVMTSQASENLAQCHKGNFAALDRIAAEPGPKFVFAHFLLPHHPYLFDRHGNVLRNATLANQFNFQAQLWERRGDYLEQLLYVNDAILTAVARIEQHSARPPIIVLQSDHGPQLQSGLNEIDRRRVRLANFAAFQLPGAPANLIPQGDSPVNFFRRILNFYIGTELPPLDNRHYYSEFRRPFALRDVTELVRPEVSTGVSTATE